MKQNVTMKHSNKSKTISIDSHRNTASIQRRLLPILKRHDVSRAALFGSIARGEGNRKSDLDLLVEFKGKKSLLDLVALKLDLEEKTRRKVDVLTYRALHPAIRQRILNEQVPIL